jgi:hypothetical protein
VALKNNRQKAIAGNFMQVCHGITHLLKRLSINAWVIYYSSKSKFGNAKISNFKCDRRIVDESVYPYDMGNGFVPFRRNVDFFDCCEVTILPLIPNLPLKKNKRNWGYIFRFEFLEIQHPHFEIISSLMLPEQKQIEVASVELTTHK